MQATRWLAAMLLVALTGCAVAPQAPVGLNKTAIGPSSGRIGITMSKIPEPGVELPGAGCLLCLAFAAVANSSLSSHVKTLGTEDLPQWKEAAAAQVRAAGGQAVVLAEPLDPDALPSFTSTSPSAARKDYRALAQRHGIDRLLAIEIQQVGFERTYSSYVPTSDPKAVFIGSAYLIDLKTNTYDWYEPFRIIRAADGAWDEPPAFPGLTNAYFQVLEIGKDRFLKPLVP